MAKLPVVGAKDLIKALQRQGFLTVRQKGSHIVLEKLESGKKKIVVVPNHPEIAKGTLRSILRKASLSIEDLIKLLTVILGSTPL